MPYKIETIKGEYAVLNSETGEVVKDGLHGKSRSEAAAHLTILIMQDLEGVENKESSPSKDKHYSDYPDTYVPFGVNTFAQYDAYKEATQTAREYRQEVYTLQELISNIMYDSTVEKKSKALNSLMSEFSNRVSAYETKEQEPTEEPTHPTDEPVSEDKTVDRFMVWKEADGTHRWAAVYSNNFRDDDNPSEIISEKAHKAFVYMANEGLVPMPELWHWHKDQTRWGVADHLMYEDGFAIAIGTVDKGKEVEAESVASMENLGVSHGMLKKSIIRNPDDKSIIDFYISREISSLPLARAANKFTGFQIQSVEDTTMAFTKENRDYFEAAGFSAERIAAIEGVTEKGKEEGADRERKEVTTPPVQEPVAEQVPAKVDEFNAKEMSEAILLVLKEVVDRVEKLDQRVTKSDAALVGFQTQTDAKVKEIIAQTPVLSQKELIFQSIFGDPNARVSGDSPMAKDGPKESADKDQTTPPAVTGIRFLDTLVAANLVAPAA